MAVLLNQMCVNGPQSTIDTWDTLILIMLIACKFWEIEISPTSYSTLLCFQSPSLWVVLCLLSVYKVNETTSQVLEG